MDEWRPYKVRGQAHSCIWEKLHAQCHTYETGSGITRWKFHLSIAVKVTGTCIYLEITVSRFMQSMPILTLLSHHFNKGRRVMCWVRKIDWGVAEQCLAEHCRQLGSVCIFHPRLAKLARSNPRGDTIPPYSKPGSITLQAMATKRSLTPVVGSGC